MYRHRLDGLTGSALTTDPVLTAHRFTNAYRASDRVSQYFISNVIYDQPRDWTDTFVRVLVFKVFNRIDTWEHLQASVDEVEVATLLDERLDEALAGFQFDDDNECRKIGYTGIKRYLRATIDDGTANTGNLFVAGMWVLGHPSRQPTSNPPA